MNEEEYERFKEKEARYDKEFQEFKEEQEKHDKELFDTIKKMKREWDKTTNEDMKAIQQELTRMAFRVMDIVTALKSIWFNRRENPYDGFMESMETSKEKGKEIIDNFLKKMDGGE